MANLSNINNKFIVASDGKVGIGTTVLNAISGTNPTLTLGGTGISGGLILQKAGTDTARLYENAGNMVHQGMTGIGHHFYVNAATQAMVIDTSGNVGIGNTSPSDFLSWQKQLVVGSGSADAGITIYHGSGGGNQGAIVFADGNTGTDRYGGSISYNGADEMKFFTSTTERMRIDSSGNLGISGAPDLWYTGYIGVNIGYSSAIFSNNSASDTNVTALVQNAYLNSGATAWIYKRSDEANMLQLVNGEYRFYQASSGTAGNSISWNQNMTIDNSGNVGIGTASPGAKLEVVDSNNYAKMGDLQGDSTMSLRMADNFAFPVEVQAYGSELRFNTATTSGAIPSVKMNVLPSGNVGIGETSPSDKLQIGQGHSVLVGDYFQLGSGSASIMGALGWNRDTTSGVIYNTNFGAFQMHNNEGKLCLQGYNASGVNQFQHEFYNNGNVYFVGNVGIGLTNPTVKLHVVDTTTLVGVFASNNSTRAELAIDNTSTNSVRLGLKATPSGAIIDSTNHSGSSGQPLIFQLNASEKMRITSGGVLLVNRTSSLLGVHTIQGDISDGGASVLTVYNQNLSDSSPAINAAKNSATTSSSARFIQFYADGGTIPMGGIVGNGASNVQFAAISDIREKENIKTIESSLNKISKLNPVEFDWKKSGEHINAGFIAQEVEEVFPEYVVENISNEGEEERKGLTGGMTSGIVAHLVKSIQELKADNDSLKARIETLENN
jgi:hypothetical protein